MQNPWLSWPSHFFTLPPHIWHNLPLRRQALCCSLFLLKANSRQFSSLNNSVKQHCPSPLSVSVCRVCVRVCTYVCASCTVLCLNPCRCVHYVLAFVKLWTTFFLSIYIMNLCQPIIFVQHFDFELLGRCFTNFCSSSVCISLRCLLCQPQLYLINQKVDYGSLEFKVCSSLSAYTTVCVQ